MTNSSNLHGPATPFSGGPRRRTVRLPRRSLMIGAGLLPLVIAGCGTRGSAPAAVAGDQDLLQEHGFAGAEAREIIDRLEALPLAGRPQNLIASVAATSLQLQDDAGRVAELPLPEEQFYLSVAPFVETTHECAFHSLTTCRGELRRRELIVNVVDGSSGEILEEGPRTTHDNGFIGFWLPRGITADLSFTLDDPAGADYAGSATISTQAEDDLTCLTSLQLT
ncbi:CueP family metal-binding protein [Brachybacterium paraconglomeratum]|uniref:CueP family metal-binding protein n=1 Tax=Brachybacterium paraconglomeratum TaxID=173362 RepID=UPI0031E5F85A